MKFTNGMWLDKEDCKISYPTEAYTADIVDNCLVIYAPYVRISHKGNTTDGGLMTIRISSPASDVISVSMTNHAGSRTKKAVFPLNTRRMSSEVFETETHYVLASGGTEAHVAKGAPFQISFFFNGEYLTSSSGKAMAHIARNDGRTFMRERLDIEPGEYIYGLGERFTPFIRNGQSADTWNEDGGTDTDQAYKCIPFFISSRNYGVLVNSTDKVSFEIASECASKSQFSVPGETLEYFLIGANNMKTVLTRYADLAGHPALPPAWSFGLWLTTSFTTDYTEETVLHFVDGMIERGIPLSVFHFDCFWMKEFEWTSFLWDKRSFPDPAGLIRRLHDKGVKVCVWINPYIAQKSPIFKEGLDNNYFVNTGSGDVWQWDRWQPGMALVDFTNGLARGWYQKFLDDLIKMGVDSFKTDFGERIPVADPFYGAKAADEGISYFTGVSPESMHNYYTYLYNATVFEILEKRLGKNQACIFARSATVGSQKFPVHWGGDSLASYPSMAESLRGGLSLGLSGFGFWSHDIGGFEAGCTPDLYKRWTQFGLLSSHSRYHGNQEYKVPWLYDEEAVDITRLFTRLKLRFMPYLYAAAIEASAAGIPMMRPMVLEFPDDETCRMLDRQYMLGSSLLCAPVFSETGTVHYYVPAGSWTNILTREHIMGPAWRTEKHDYFTLPLLARENSILVTGKTDGTPEYDYLDSVTVTVYDLLENTTALADVYAIGGSKTASVSARLENGRITVKTEGLTGVIRLLLANVYGVKSATAGTPEESDWGTMIDFNRQSVEIVL